MKIHPLRDQVLIEPMKEEVKKGGIILPDTVTKERKEQGKVLAVGEKVASVKKGQVVLFGKYDPKVIVVDSKDCLFVKEEDIVAVIE